MAFSTKESTKRQIDVMQAAVDGELIEYRRKIDTEWLKYPKGIPEWNWLSFEYRIKHTPIYEWINIYEEESEPGKVTIDMWGMPNESEKQALYGRTTEDGRPSRNFVACIKREKK